MTAWLLVAGGVVLLYAGAELLVKGATGLALSFRISPIVIGLTVVAYGTSAPENRGKRMPQTMMRCEDDLGGSSNDSRQQAAAETVEQRGGNVTTSPTINIAAGTAKEPLVSPRVAKDSHRIVAP